VVLLAFDGLVAYDMIQKMMHHTRPYEIEEGASEAVHDKYLAQLLDVMRDHSERIKTRGGQLLAYLGMGLEDYEELLERAQAEFAAIPRRDEDRPLVGVVGEFYVRLHPDSNQNIVRKLEKAGAEVWLAPLTEFVMYSNYLTGWLAEDALRDQPTWLNARMAMGKRFLASLAEKVEHGMFHATLPYMDGYDDVPPREVVDLGADYVNRRFGGEAICSMGKAEDFAIRGADGVVSVAPFNCMPGMTVTALSQSLRERHGGIPFLCLEYDGFEDAARDTKIRTFVKQIADARAARKATEAQGA
jgi:predicted nucleotide-binding protein (sugar kinase/HSP70/actin superfamily)